MYLRMCCSASALPSPRFYYLYYFYLSIIYLTYLSLHFRSVLCLFFIPIFFLLFIFMYLRVSLFRSFIRRGFIISLLFLSLNYTPDLSLLILRFLIMCIFCSYLFLSCPLLWIFVCVFVSPVSPFHPSRSYHFFLLTIYLPYLAPESPCQCRDSPARGGQEIEESPFLMF